MKKNILFTTLLTLSAFSLSADNPLCGCDDYVPCCDNPSVSMQEQIDRISEQNVYCCWQGKSQSASVACGPTFFADFLYWKPSTEGLSPSQTLVITVPTNILEGIDVEGEVDDLNFHWDPGLRVGLGYVLPQRQQWALSAVWSYFYSSAKVVVDTNPSATPLEMSRPMWLPFLLGSVADHASAHWNLNFNLLDFMIARDFFIGKWLSINPQAGIRVGWIRQKYLAKYHGGQELDANGVQTTLYSDTFFSGQNNFQGTGLKFGSDFEWHLNKCFSIQANGFISLLYGKFTIDEIYSGAFPLDFGAGAFLLPERIYLDKVVHAVRPNFETEIGVKWQMWLCSNSYRFALGAYYDFSFWPWQNNLVNQFFSRDTTPLIPPQRLNSSYVVNLNPQGNLSFQGIRINLSLDF